MATKYACTICEQPEVKCKCDRYCSICYGDFSVRLCEDGCYYCAECREICGYTVEDLIRE